MARIPYDLYITPQPLARKAVSFLKGARHRTCLDPSCGTGVWGKAIWNRYELDLIIGIDIRSNPMGKKTHPYTKLFHVNYLEWGCSVSFDLVVCNPPYGAGRTNLAEKFIRKSLHLLAPGGEAVFLLRTSFLGGQDRGGVSKHQEQRRVLEKNPDLVLGLWKEYPPAGIYISSRRPSYTGDGHSEKGMEYMVVRWEQGYRGPLKEFDWFTW